MDMEDLLCPQISMDVDETPLELGNQQGDKDETGSTTSDDMPLDVKIKILLEVEEFDAAQIPEPLTEEEEALKNTVFNLGPAVQFMRLHCTSCNVHLGSAPTNQFNRFIHPLLHVLLCKKCYDFYSSGEFEKDEDGSELYCRWCGQGGKVMCCSDCCFVFCQKCVRTNLGKKTLDGIKNSEEWKCFVCSPQQLINLKLICHSLYQYVMSEISIAKESKMESALTIDHSMCCKASTRPPKRKKSISVEDVNYQPGTNVFSVKKMKNVLKTAMTSFEPSEMTTNGQLALNPSFQPAVAIPSVRNRMPILNKYLKVRPLARQPGGPRPRFNLIAPKPVPFVGTSTMRNPIMAHQLARPAISGSQNYIPLNNPPVRVVPTKSGSQFTPVVNCVPANLTPGTKHNWFEQAASITTNITNQLIRKLANFSMEQKNATTIEQLASIHNKLQELLSSSVNSLIHVRKNLRNEFLNDLNKMKFAKSPPPLAPIITQINPIPLAPAPPIDDDDDDVIIINNEEDPLAINTSEPLTIPEQVPPPPLPPIEHDPNKPRIFLKVKPVSSLMDASRIPPPEKVPEHIDLCDDDEDETNKYEEHRASVIETVTITPKRQPEIDLETSRQIKRALSESKYEAVVQENLKVKVVPGLMPAKALKRMITVRVIVDPKWIPKRKLIVPIEDHKEDVSDSINDTAVCDTQEIRFEAGDDSSKVAIISSDEEVEEIDKNDTSDVEVIGINDININEVCKTANNKHDHDDVVCENNSIEKNDAIIDRDNVMDITNETDKIDKTDKDFDKTASPVGEVDKTASSIDEVKKAMLSVEELEKATSSVEELEKATSSVEELNQTTSSIGELERTTSSIDELDKTTPSVGVLENTPSAEELVNTASIEEVHEIDNEEDLQKNNPVSKSEELNKVNEADTDKKLDNNSSIGTATVDLKDANSPETEISKDVNSSLEELSDTMDLDKNPQTELNSGCVNGSDSEKVNNLSDDFNPFRNVENGDDIYDRRKEVNTITDKVSEFEVSTDPVTTTDSGIEVDAK